MHFTLLKRRGGPKYAIATKVITTLLALILTLNNFIFNSKFYLQIKGSAMEQYAPLNMQKYSCPSLKRDISVLSLKTNPAAICTLLTIV